MIHTSHYKPVYVPIGGTGSRGQIDRLQDLTFSLTFNRNKIKEVGRTGLVGWKATRETSNATLRQLETGSIAFYNLLANKASNNNLITQDDFKQAYGDILGYKTDDNGTFLGTVQYQKMRTQSINLNIGDPQSNAERSFSLVGEDELFWQNDNKQVIDFQVVSATTGALNIVIGSGDLASYPAPVADPDNGLYIQKLFRVRSGVVTELVLGTDYTYTFGTKTIALTSVSGDVYKGFYTSGSYITGVEPFTPNDVDAIAISADSCSIFLESANYLYRLQSFSGDISFERQDVGEIGNREIVSRGIKETNVSITLGRILEQMTIEEILRGKAGENYGKLDPRKMGYDYKLIVKIYSDETKSNFLMGYSFAGLGPVNLDAGVPLDDYATRGVQLQGEKVIITTEESSL